MIMKRKLDSHKIKRQAITLVIKEQQTIRFVARTLDTHENTL